MGMMMRLNLVLGYMCDIICPRRLVLWNSSGTGLKQHPKTMNDRRVKTGDIPQTKRNSKEKTGMSF